MGGIYSRGPPITEDEDIKETSDNTEKEIGMPDEEAGENKREDSYGHSRKNEECELAINSDTDTSLFGADEYHYIVSEMLPEVTDMQLSSKTVFDPDEMQILGSLS
jgi:hypothetical protein